MIRLLWVAIAATAFFGCGSDYDTTSMANDRTEVPNLANARDSVSWVGTYRGVLPCESGCLGEETELTLRPDNTYTWVRRYKGKDEKLYREVSTFEWSKDGGIITLDTEMVHPRNGKQRIFKYRVSEGRLTRLDHLGEPIEGSMSSRYHLAKADTDSRLQGRYYRLAMLDGVAIDTTIAQDKQAHLLFTEGNNTLSGSAGCNRFKGEYRLDDANKSMMRLGKVVATKMACPADDTERRMLTALERTAAYRLDGDRLMLMDDKGKVIAELEYTFFGSTMA